MATLYEILTIIHPDETDDGVDAIIGGLRQTLTQSGGEVLAVDKWGRRKLAYPIAKKDEGFYAIIHVEGPPNLPAEFRAHTRIRESILRELVVTLDDAHEAAVRKKIEEAGPEDAEAAAAQLEAAEQRAAEKRAAAAMTAAEAAAAEAEAAADTTVVVADGIQATDSSAPAEAAVDDAAAEVAPADEPAEEPEPQPEAAEAAPAEEPVEEPEAAEAAPSEAEGDDAAEPESAEPESAETAAESAEAAADEAPADADDEDKEN